jgi:hypothetical protein
MGYFKWYWGRYGFFKTLKDFFGAKILNTIIYNVFYQAGMSVGAYFL